MASRLRILNATRLGDAHGIGNALTTGSKVQLILFEWFNSTYISVLSLLREPATGREREST